MQIFLAYLHILGIMVLMGSLIAEHLMLKPSMSKAQIKSLAVTDLIYGLSAILVLVTGLLRWLAVGKGAAYYLENPLFHIKLTVFIVVALLSIYPTIKFLKWRRLVVQGFEPDPDPKLVSRLLMYIRLELLLVAAIPLMAVMIARGVGF